MILSVYEISPAEWMTTQRLYLTWYRCICVIKPTYLMTSHPMYVWNHTHCMHDTICTLHDITSTLADNTSTASLYSHPDYRSYNPHCVYDNTGTICMISCEYIWHHIHSLWYNTMLWHSHTLYSCHHTQDTCRRIHCSRAITYSLLIRAGLQYVWYQSTICMTSYVFYVISQPLLLTSKDCTHYITSKIFLNSEPTLYDITYTTLVTSQPL